MQKTRIFDTVAVGGAGGADGGAVQIVIFIEMIAGGEVETHGGSHSTHAQASEKTTPLVSTSHYFLHFNVCVCGLFPCAVQWPVCAFKNKTHWPHTGGAHCAPPVCGQHFIARPEPAGAVDQ